MWRISSLLILACVICPAAAQAIQLRWSSGATDLTFTAATRCTLIAQADSAEQHLPGEWRLLWRADCEVRPRTEAAPEDGPAAVCDIHYPATLAEIASNIVTVGFCPDTSGVAQSAKYVLDLPAGSRGKLKVVALDPDVPDSSAIIESGEATFNGGIDGSYPMAVLRMKSDHATNQLRIDAVGSGLALARGATVTTSAFADIPLAITVQDDTSLTAVANIPTALPAASVWIAGAEGFMAAKSIPPDPLLNQELPDSAVYVDPDSTIYPKDFTLFFASTPIGGGVWQSMFHIFYIRACHKDTTGPHCENPDSTDKWFGHAWSRDLVHWNQNIHAFGVGDSAWDHANVWAPSIVLTGTKFYMFYTGVDSASKNQTIGFATADCLDTLDLATHWKRESAPVLTPLGTDWIKKVQPWQFRDPFVMPDPTNPNSRFLMFFTARDSITNANAVGVARSDPNDLATWSHIGYYQSTDSTHTHIADLESPHVFREPVHALTSQTDEVCWRIMYTDAGWFDWRRAILFTTKLASSFSTLLTDLDPAHWSASPTALYEYLGFQPPDSTTKVEYGHQASEVMRFGNAWYWGAYDGIDLRFRKVVWKPDSVNFELGNVDVLDAARAEVPGVVRFNLAELVPASGRARFRVELPGAMKGTVAVYDVMGRRVRTLLDGQLSPGASIISWDGRSRRGVAVGSGVYFARLVVGGRSYVLRIPVVR